MWAHRVICGLFGHAWKPAGATRREQLCHWCLGWRRMNPDCRDGKHASCSGDGWDEHADQPCACPCGCHQTDRKNATD